MSHVSWQRGVGADGEHVRQLTALPAAHGRALAPAGPYIVSGRTRFAPESSSGLDSTGFWHAFPLTYELRHLTREGRLDRIVRRAWQPKTLPDEVRASYPEWYERRGENLSAAGRARVRAEVRQFTFMDTLPAFSTFLVTMVSREKSHEEAREEYVRLMGPELGALFHTLSSELTWLHWQWRQYRILFGDKKSRLDLLNQSAPFFFGTIQLVLFEDTLLSLARLVGPTKSAGKPNLTVQRLPELVGVIHDADRVEELVQNAVSAADFAVDWRNRRIAHRDLKLQRQRSRATADR